MGRITEEERIRFHKILDESIDKMNSPKNSEKCHWSVLNTFVLQKMINTENAELDLAVTEWSFESISQNPEYKNHIESENFDLVNLNLMMVDNLRGNK